MTEFMPQRLRPELAAIDPALIIFDKDGTLLDFNAMWAGWVTELARRLETETNQAVTNRLFDLLGFDPNAEQVTPEGHLAITPMATIQTLVVDMLYQIGFSPEAAKVAVSNVWYIPDPIILAQPITDLSALFSALQTLGLKIAIATADDRTPTLATLTELGLMSFVEAMACADDGGPVKPAPDMVLRLCQELNIPLARTIMVGDTVADLKMGCAAGVGLVVGVLSGVSSEVTLTPYADIVLPDVGGLIENHCH